ncbi:MAG: helicase-associated domain-containing protein [Acidimicrobiales bacterium]
MPAVARPAPATSPWAEALDAASDDQLVALLATRPDLAAGGPASLGEVAAQIVTTASARAHFERADDAARKALESLCALPRPAALATLAGALGSSPEAVAPVVERLVRTGMALAQDGAVVVNPGLPPALLYPCRLGPPAAQAMSELSLRELAAIASRLGVVVRPKGSRGTRADAVAEIVRALGDAKHLVALLGGAPAGTDKLLQQLTAEWPAVDLPFAAYHMTGNDRTPAGWCLGRGLLVTSSWATAVMPREAGLALRGGRLFTAFSPLPPVLDLADRDTEAAGRQAADAALRVVADVSAICDALGAAPAKLLQGGGLGVREVRRMAKVVDRPEDVAARLVEVAGAAGLVGVEGDSALPTTRFDDWSQLRASARWARLAMSWINFRADLSVTGTPGANGKPVAPLLPRADPSAPGRRGLMLGELANAGPAAGATTASLVARALWRSPGAWKGASAGPDQLARWVLEETDQLGLSAGGALSSFGQHLVEGRHAAAEEALGALAPPLVGEVVLQADLTAVVAGEAEPALGEELDLLADVESTGHATVWRFSEPSLRRAFDAGRRAPQILAMLAEHAPKGVPQPLAYLIEDVDRRFGLVRVGPGGCYVTSDDPSLLAEIVRSRRTARLQMRLLAPTVAVSPATPAVVLDAVRDSGYLPAPEGPDGALVVSRPPARRIGGQAAGAGSGPDRYGDILAELMSDPELVELLAATPPELLAPLFVARAGAHHGAGPPQGPKDLAGLVVRLRRGRPAAPDSKAGGTTAGRARPRSPLSPPFVPAHEPCLDTRPPHIAKGIVAVVSMLDLACDQGWPVRMSYVNSRGVETEFYAEVISVNRATCRVGYLPAGGGTQLTTGRIQWARIVTAAEEEAQDL